VGDGTTLGEAGDEAATEGVGVGAAIPGMTTGAVWVTMGVTTITLGAVLGLLQVFLPWLQVYVLGSVKVAVISGAAGLGGAVGCGPFSTGHQVVYATTTSVVTWPTGQLVTEGGHEVTVYTLVVVKVDVYVAEAVVASPEPEPEPEPVAAEVVPAAAAPVLDSEGTVLEPAAAATELRLGMG
jgi:hypothetical protein